MSRRRKLSRKPKTIRNNPKRYFYDLEYVGDNWLLFDEEMQMWVDYDNTIGLATTSVLCNTLKAAIHHLKKHKEIPVGETFLLRSAYEGMPDIKLVVKTSWR